MVDVSQTQDAPSGKRGDMQPQVRPRVPAAGEKKVDGGEIAG